MTLETSVYSAYRGYSWSSVPSGIPLCKLNQLYRFISVARGDFPDPLSVEVGLVSDGTTAAAFTIQNVEKWDSEKRNCDYAAFAFFPVELGAKIDFIDLLNNDFFWTPSRTPATTLDYVGKASSAVPPSTICLLQERNNYLLNDPHAIGFILAKCGGRSSRWVCRMGAENILRIECNSWT